jgi:hypothetical protein
VGFLKEEMGEEKKETRAISFITFAAERCHFRHHLLPVSYRRFGVFTFTRPVAW